MVVTEIQVSRNGLSPIRIHRREAPALAEGEVMARVDEFALTANNVTYGVAGDMIGYWKFFPAEGDWGILPVWGFATVVASRSESIGEGERIWGYLPMASHVTLRPGEVGRGGFTDLSAHRQGLPEIYNRYQRTSADPPELKGLEAERCALFPVFATSFVIADFLEDNAWFGARQVLILSASSKTGVGLANLLARREGRPVRVIGVTSRANRGFVESLGDCDQVLAYEEIGELDPEVPTAAVDMAGAQSVRRAVHRHFGARLVHDCSVGLTHWTDFGAVEDLPGAPPTMFFAPAVIAKRDAEWGPGETMRRAQAQSARIARELAGRITIERIAGAEASAAVLAELVAGKVSPERLLMLSLA